VIALPLALIIPVLRPLTWAVTAIARWILRILRLDEPEGRIDRRVTPLELRAVFEQIDEGAGMSQLESRLVQNILFFPRTTAEEVMTPRVDITAAPVTSTPDELTELIQTTKHSRVPLYDRTLDEIVGYLPSKSFLIDPQVPLTKLIRPVLVVPEKAPIDRIFQDMRKGRWRMVIVVNEYGETVGLFTQEDLIEEIVGEISDEYELPEEEIVRIGDGVYEIRGRASVQDLGAALEVTLPQEQAVTVNGFLCSLFGGFPRVGTRLRWEDLEFEVTEVARHRVLKARVRRIEPVAEG
jgi:CBS domain containing-hemolysin-like protein